MVEMGAGALLGRLGDPAASVAVAAFRASGDSGFMTGSEVFVDDASRRFDVGGCGRHRRHLTAFARENG